MKVRFRLRTLMLGVALVAVAGACIQWGARMRSRSQAYQNDAFYHDLARQLAAFLADDDLSAKSQREAARKSEEWHAKRRDLYLDAASHPWRNVPPAAEPKFD